jgi:hypothetical protein
VFVGWPERQPSDGRSGQTRFMPPCGQSQIPRALHLCSNSGKSGVSGIQAVLFWSPSGATSWEVTGVFPKPPCAPAGGLQPCGGFFLPTRTPTPWSLPTPI